MDIHVPDRLKKKFRELSPLFIVDTIPEELIPEHMKQYQLVTGRSQLKKTKKLLGVMKTEKILVYTPVLKWYLKQGLVVTAVHKTVEYKSSRPFEFFTKEVTEARRNGDIEGMVEKLLVAYNNEDGDTFNSIMVELEEVPEIMSLMERSEDMNELLGELYFKYSGNKQLGDTFKLKGNSFYGKMIENVEHH